jgi:predicted DNA-binding transcriptional regulator AlpA
MNRRRPHGGRLGARDTAFIKSEIAIWAKVINAAGIKGE